MISIESHILETLSFFDPMSLEQIILDFDESVVIQHPNFTKVELSQLLAELKKRRVVKVIKQEGETLWVKCYKKRKKWYQIF